MPTAGYTRGYGASQAEQSLWLVGRQARGSSIHCRYIFHPDSIILYQHLVTPKQSASIHPTLKKSSTKVLGGKHALKIKTISTAYNIC